MEVVIATSVLCGVYDIAKFAALQNSTYHAMTFQSVKKISMLLVFMGFTYNSISGKELCFSKF